MKHPTPGAAGKRGLIRNSLWIVICYALGGIAVVIALPSYTRFLGMDRFGVFLLLSTITAPLSVLSSGIAQATTKYVAEFRARRDLVSAALLLRTTLLLHCCIAACGILILCTLSPFICSRLFKIPATLSPEAEWAVVLAGVVWAFAQAATIFQALGLGLEKFQLVASYQSAQTVLTYGGGSLVLAFSPLLTHLLLWNLLIAVGSVVFWMIVAWVNLGRARLWPVWDRNSARVSVHFGLWQAINSALTALLSQVDKVLLGVVRNTAEVGFYGVAQNVQSRLVGVVWSGMSTLFPTSSSLVGVRGASEELILDKGWTLSFLGASLYAIIFSVGPSLLRIWLGPTIAAHSSTLLRILIAAALVGLPSAVLSQYMLGRALTRVSTLGNGGTAVITVILSATLIPNFGLRGAAWGVLCGLVLTRPVFHIWFLRRYFWHQNGTFYSFRTLYSVLLSGFCAFLVGSAFEKALNQSLPGGVGLLISCTLLPVLVLFVTGSMEILLGHQRRIKSMLRSVEQALSARTVLGSAPAEPVGLAD